MSRATRWAIVICACLAPLAGFAWAFPEMAVEAGLDVWDAPRLQGVVDGEQNRSESLEANLRASVERLTLKAEIADEVIAGRVSLRAAALWYRAMNAHVPVVLVAMKLKYPEGSNDELHVRNVIDTVRSKPKEMPQPRKIFASATLYGGEGRESSAPGLVRL